MDLKNTKVNRFTPSEQLPENDYHHSFVITEYKPASNATKSGDAAYVMDMKSSSRHILCCGSDVERDAWVTSLCQEILKFRPRDKGILNELSNIRSAATANSATALTGTVRASPGSPSKWINEAVPRSDSLSHDSPPSSSLSAHPPSASSPKTRERPTLPLRTDSSNLVIATSKDIFDKVESLPSPLRAMLPSSAYMQLDEHDRVMQQKEHPLLKDQVGDILHVAIAAIPKEDSKPSIWNYIKGKGILQVFSSLNQTLIIFLNRGTNEIQGTSSLASQPYFWSPP